MISEDNPYSKMQKEYYENEADNMAKGNHIGHNSNFNYWKLLLGDILFNTEKWNNKIALDIGCGAGRNIINLLHISKWRQVIGMDISKNNLKYTKENVKKEFGEKCISQLAMIESNGVDMYDLQSDYVDFAMSTICFEHIAVYKIRYNLLSEVYRVLNEGGLFSFQMCFDSEEKIDDKRYNEYYKDYWDAESTNSNCDCVITDPIQIISDLEKIGFKNITYNITDSWSSSHDNWIFIKCFK